MSTLQQLKRAGSIALWHDYRSGHAYDFSGNNNHGTLVNNPTLTRNGFQFDYLSDSAIQVSNSASLNITTLTLFALFGTGRCAQFNNTPQLFRKHDPTGFDWGVRLDESSTIVRIDGGASKAYNITREFAGIKGVSMGLSEGADTTKLFVDGVFNVDISGEFGFNGVNADVYIGNWYQLNRGVGRTISAMLLFNRLLTETEHAQIFGEIVRGG